MLQYCHETVMTSTPGDLTKQGIMHSSIALCHCIVMFMLCYVYNKYYMHKIDFL